MALGDFFEQLLYLSTLDFSGWNETEVRENFISPLLGLLGYRKNTDYDINCETSHPLHKPFIQAGRQKVRIDYGLRVGKKQFWIIEAKSAYDREISEKSIFQAHYYALHPEVNARYFAVINGWNIVVYDSRNIDENYQPILKFETNKLPENFSSLNKLLGAKSIASMLKKRVLEDIRDILSIEVMEERLQEFSLEVNSILESVRPVVRENRENIYLRKENEFKQIVQSSNLEDMIKVGFSFAEFNLLYEAFNSKFEILDNLEKSKIVTTILQVLRGRASICHRRNLIILLVKILPSNGKLADPLSFSSIADEIKRSIKDCLTHFENQPWLIELWKLEGNLYRVYYKLTFASNEWFERFFNDIVKIKKELLEDEELIFQNLKAPGLRVEFIEKSVIKTYYQCISRDEKSLLQLNCKLNEFEARIDARFQEEIQKVHPEDKILLNYPVYNKPLDFLNSGLFHFLYENYEIVEPLLDDESLDLILKLIQKDREQYRAFWIDVFLIRYLFNQNQYEILETVSSNYSDNLNLLILLKNLFNSGKIITSIEPSLDNNTNNIVKISILDYSDPEKEWAVEGALDIQDKLIKVTALHKKNKYISNPIKPIQFLTTETDKSEGND